MKAIMKRVFLCLLTIFSFLTMNAQSGLDCNNSIPIVSSSSCTFQSFSTSGPEIWLQFIPATNFVNISLETEFFGENLPHIHYMALIGGTCSSPIIIADDELAFVDSARTLQIDLNANVVAGNTYFIKILREGPSQTCDKTGCTGGGPATFDICVQDINVIIPVDFGLELPGSSTAYITNRGQLIKTDGTSATEFKLYTANTNPSLYFTDNSVTYLFANLDTNNAALDTLCRVDMTLVGGNAGTKIFKTEQAPGYNNYFLAHIPKGVVNNKNYFRTVNINVYPDIDMEWYSNSVGEKFYFIIKPGGNPDDIILKFEGATSVIATPTGGLIVTTPLGNIEYEPPHAYRINPGNNVVPMPWQAKFIQVTANSVKFETHNYDPIMPLFIQVDKGHSPSSTTSLANLEWSSYYASNLDEKIYDITADAQGNAWIAGYTESASIPTSPGFSTANGSTSGSQDAFYTKFDANAEIKHRTFYGGNVDDRAYSVACAGGTGNIIFVGETNSNITNNYAAGGNLNYSSLSGTSDGFIVQVNSLGTSILMDSYIGGVGSDACTKVDINSSTEFVVGGYSNSATGFPILSLAGAYNQNPKGDYDGFVMHILSLSQDWSTFIGGSGKDVLKDISTTNGRIACYLSTETTTSTVVPSPANTPTVGGSLIMVDILGPVDYMQSTYGGGTNDGYVVYFNLSHQIEWSSYLGTNFKDVGSFFDSDLYDNGNCGIELTKTFEILITGTLLINTGVPITGEPLVPVHLLSPTAYSQTSLGATAQGYDKYIAKFEPDRSLSWYTLFGGGQFNCESYATDIVTNPGGYIFITGSEFGAHIQDAPNYCTIPTTGEFPICNATGNGYMETDNNGENFCNFRTFITEFDPSGQLVWSTRYGTNNTNSGQAIATGKLPGGEEVLFLTGWATDNPSAPGYTFMDLAGTTLDWLDATPNGSGTANDGVVARFSLTGLINLIGIPNESPDNLAFTVYPNPATDLLNISFSNNLPFRVVIYNAIGQVVYSSPLAYSANSIDISTLSTGLYTVNLFTMDNHKYAAKFIKK